MKTMSFIPKTTNNFRYNDFTDYSKILDAIITGNVKKKNPYLFSDYEEPKKKTIDIEILLDKKNNNCCYGCPLKGECNKNAFAEAFDFLLNYKKDNYDFKLYDGTPVKKFADGSIQIGYDLYYPTKQYTNIFDCLDYKAKKNIIDIYISLR